MTYIDVESVRSHEEPLIVRETCGVLWLEGREPCEVVIESYKWRTESVREERAEKVESHEGMVDASSHFPTAPHVSLQLVVVESHEGMVEASSHFPTAPNVSVQLDS